MAEEKRIFIEEDAVETRIFDWGCMSWLAEARVTAAEKFSAGVVDLSSGKGHDTYNHPGVEEILYVVSGKGQQAAENASGE